MPVLDAGKNLMLNALAEAADTVSLHTANPGTTGASEVTGGSPAYARKPVDWSPAAAGNLDSLSTPAFDVPAGVTVSWVTFWAGSTALATGELSPHRSFSAQGVLTLSDADLSLTD